MLYNVSLSCLTNLKKSSFDEIKKKPFSLAKSNSRDIKNSRHRNRSFLYLCDEVQKIDSRYHTCYNRSCGVLPFLETLLLCYNQSVIVPKKREEWSRKKGKYREGKKRKEKEKESGSGWIDKD